MKYFRDRDGYVLHAVSEDSVPQDVKLENEHPTSENRKLRAVGKVIAHHEKTRRVVSHSFEDEKDPDRATHVLVKSVLEQRSKVVRVAYVIVDAKPVLLTHGIPDEIAAWVSSHPNGMSNGHKILVADLDCDADLLNKALGLEIKEDKDVEIANEAFASLVK